MTQSQVLALAYGSLMVLIFAGSYALGDDSWMAYLLFVPALLILRAMFKPGTDDDVRIKSLLSQIFAVSARRLIRIGLALVAVLIPAGLLIEALNLNELSMLLVLAPALLLVSLVDREYFGWTGGDDHSPSAPTA